jgi:3-oxoacyl-[acyl-carrier-protein] synthase II
VCLRKLDDCAADAEEKAGTIDARDRIAITGMGVVSAAGATIASFWDTLVAARAVARAIQRIDMSESPVRFGCEVDDLDAHSALSAKEARRTDRVTQLTLSAADAALRDAGYPERDTDAARVAVVIGNGFGGLDTAERSAREFLGLGEDAIKGRVNPLFIPTVMPNASAAAVSLHHGLRGPCLCVATACAAGAHAIGEGMRMLRDGSADVVVAGGAEAPLTPWVVTGFAAARTLSTRADDPGAASRPFDRDRDGFVMAEGAGVVILERLDDARARSAAVHAELVGYARNTDAYNIVAPPPDGRGAAECMRLALADAGAVPRDVAHVNAHGTSTVHNDAAEAVAVRTVFGNDAPPVTSVKGVLGHSIGAAGALEAIASALTLSTGTIPPTANHTEPDPDIDLDVVTEARALGDGLVVSNSFAFGGHNAVLVFGTA